MRRRCTCQVAYLGIRSAEPFETRSKNEPRVLLG